MRMINEWFLPAHTRISDTPIEMIVETVDMHHIGVTDSGLDHCAISWIVKERIATADWQAGKIVDVSTAASAREQPTMLLIDEKVLVKSERRSPQPATFGRSIEVPHGEV